jgi:hypothetical protein
MVLRDTRSMLEEVERRLQAPPYPQLLAAQRRMLPLIRAIGPQLPQLYAVAQRHMRLMEAREIGEARQEKMEEGLKLLESVRKYRPKFTKIKRRR